MMHNYLPIALRVHTERAHKKEPQWQGRRKPPPQWGNIVVLLDTETWTDTRQSLKFGCARICRWRNNGTLDTRREYLFYADDLRDRDPEGFLVLETYVRVHKENGLRLLPLRDFLDHVLWPACKIYALIVAFNLPFDLSRLALEWSEAQGKYAGGFSLTLWHLRKKVEGKDSENRNRPRVRIKNIDNKRALLGLSQPGKKGEEVRARLLDLKTLTYVLTDRGHSLKSACEAFQTAHRKKDADYGRITPEFIHYNRSDVLLLRELFEKLRAEFDLHPIDIDPTKTLSPAGIAKGYLTAMGITPPKDKFKDLPKEAFSIPMLAYHGGRAECHVRAQPVPIVHCDTASMYPTIHTLMDLWPLTSRKKTNSSTLRMRSRIF